MYARTAILKGTSEANQLQQIIQSVSDPASMEGDRDRRRLGTPPRDAWPVDAVVDHSFYGNFARLPDCGENGETRHLDDD